MRKTKLVKYILIVVSLITWGAFCWIKIPQYQAENRAKDAKLRMQIQQEHDRNYVDMIDPEGNVHSVPRSEYEEAHKTETVESTKEVSYMEYDEATLELLARLCESESGIESYQCKVYVASVVLNRCLSEYHPDTIEEVIWERVDEIPQFSVTIKHNGTCMLESVEPSEDSFKAAQYVLEHGPQLPEGVTVFYSNTCKDDWVTTRETYTTLDHTIFAYYWGKE